MDCDFVHFFEDGIKLKTPSDFYPPLTASVMHHNTQSYKTLRNDLYGIDFLREKWHLCMKCIDL